MRDLIFTHFLLNLYILAILQPVLPIVEYVVNYDYIKSELCVNVTKPILTCNGKCYLQKQIELQSLPSGDQELPIPPKIDLEKLVLVIINPLDFDCPINPILKNKPFFIRELEETIFIPSLLRPPIS